MLFISEDSISFNEDTYSYLSHTQNIEYYFANTRGRYEHRCKVKESHLISKDITNKIPKIPNPPGDKLVVSKANGEIEETSLTAEDT